jgi:hypothetical protein
MGGLSIAASDAFGTPRTRAIMIILAYAGFVIGSAIAVRHAGGYIRRFGLGLSAFTVATVVVCGYLVGIVNPYAFDAPFSVLAWRFGFLSALGIVATAVPLALGALFGRFGGGQGASRAPLKTKPAHRDDSNHHGGMRRQADASGTVSPIIVTN